MSFCKCNKFHLKTVLNGEIKKIDNAKEKLYKKAYDEYRGKSVIMTLIPFSKVKLEHDDQIHKYIIEHIDPYFFECDINARYWRKLDVIDRLMSTIQFASDDYIYLDSNDAEELLPDDIEEELSSDIVHSDKIDKDNFDGC